MLSVQKVLVGIKATAWNGLSDQDASNHATWLQQRMEEYHIDDVLRGSAFLAQLAHETGGWHWMKELGGPSYFSRYDGRHDLGNYLSGDGYRFRGRGYIQLTGRANYQHFAELLSLPLLEHPELASSVPVAAWIAAAFWDEHNLNAMADDGRFMDITKVINGGLNGWDDRLAKYKKLRVILK